MDDDLLLSMINGKAPVESNDVKEKRLKNLEKARVARKEKQAQRVKEELQQATMDHETKKKLEELEQLKASQAEMKLMLEELKKSKAEEPKIVEEKEKKKKKSKVVIESSSEDEDEEEDEGVDNQKYEKRVKARQKQLRLKRDDEILTDYARSQYSDSVRTVFREKPQSGVPNYDLDWLPRPR